MRAVSLLEYSANRRYRVTSDKGKLRSETQVSLQYQSPDSKQFKVLSESGPGTLRNIIKSLLTFETEAALGRAGNNSSITSTNYTFQLAGRDTVEGYDCVVVKASPKRKDKYLFEGQIWTGEGIRHRQNCRAACEKTFLLDQERRLYQTLPKN